MLSGFLLLLSAFSLRHLSYMPSTQWNCSGVPSSKKALVLPHGICDIAPLSVVRSLATRDFASPPLLSTLQSCSLFCSAGPHSSLSLSLVFCSSTSSTTSDGGGGGDGCQQQRERRLSVAGRRFDERRPARGERPPVRAGRDAGDRGHRGRARPRRSAARTDISSRHCSRVEKPRRPAGRADRSKVRGWRAADRSVTRLPICKTIFSSVAIRYKLDLA